MIEFQVFADFGVFTLMFLNILRTFANIILVLAPFIVGFAYAFYAILSETVVLERFNNQTSIYTIMKVEKKAAAVVVVIVDVFSYSLCYIYLAPVSSTYYFRL